MDKQWSTRWVSVPMVCAAVVLASLGLVAHASQAFTGAYLNHLSGIWLALGRDLASGVFFRDLSGPEGYGGTRYFPLFFAIIGGLIRLGLSPLAAGCLASTVSGALFIVGMARVYRALGAPARVVCLAAAGAAAPYFVQQTLFEIRADVLAAAWNLLGLAAAVPLWRDQSAPDRRCWPAACWFTLALATKVTSLAVPVFVVSALFVTGRRWAAARMAASVGLGAAAFLAVVGVASAGRSFESWRACMFAGQEGSRVVQGLFDSRVLALMSTSRLLTALATFVVLALAAVAILEARGRHPPGPTGEHRLTRSASWVPVVLLAGVTASTAFTLASPGVVVSNHVVEWVGIVLVALGWTACARAELRIAISGLLVVLVVWMSAQDVVRAGQLWWGREARSSAAARERVTGLIARASAPVLSESPLWPVLAGQQPMILDPFALRVVMLTRQDIARDLGRRIESRAFPLVILQVDPTSGRGRGHYEHVHFGWPVIASILANYRFDSRPAPDVWIYVPRTDEGP